MRGSLTIVTGFGQLVQDPGDNLCFQVLAHHLVVRRCRP